MFTSLSANVGFNPLLAGALACGALPEKCLPQQEEGEAGDWGPIHRGRGRPPQPSVAPRKANGNGFSRGCILNLHFYSRDDLASLPMIGKRLPVLWSSMPTQEKEQWLCPWGQGRDAHKDMHGNTSCHLMSPNLCQAQNMPKSHPWQCYKIGTILPTFQWGNWGSEKFNKLPKIVLPREPESQDPDPDLSDTKEPTRLGPALGCWPSLCTWFCFNPGELPSVLLVYRLAPTSQGAVRK